MERLLHVESRNLIKLWRAGATFRRLPRACHLPRSWRWRQFSAQNLALAMMQRHSFSEVQISQPLQEVTPFKDRDSFCLLKTIKHWPRPS